MRFTLGLSLGTGHTASARELNVASGSCSGQRKRGGMGHLGEGEGECAVGDEEERDGGLLLHVTRILHFDTEQKSPQASS